MSLTHSSDRSAPWENRHHIRRLRRADRADFTAHLLRLDGESRRLRFGAAVTDAVLTRYAAGTLEPGSLVKGFFVEGVLRGAAELRDIVSPRPEAAFSLERPFQGQGHGARLFASLVDAARNGNIPRFTLQCLSDNVAMQKIARRHAAQLHFEDGEVTAELLHPGGDLASLAREAAEERFAASLAAADRALYRLAAELGVDLRLRAV